jgi:hypothetical protein
VKRSSRTHRTGTGHKRLWGRILQCVGGEAPLRPTGDNSRGMIRVNTIFVSVSAARVAASDQFPSGSLQVSGLLRTREPAV